MMPDVVLVRKHDRRANLDRRDVGDELFVLLIDDRIFRSARRRGAGLCVDNRIRQKHTLSVFHSYAQGPGVKYATADADYQPDDGSSFQGLIGKGHPGFKQVVNVLERIAVSITKFIPGLDGKILVKGVTGGHGK